MRHIGTFAVRFRYLVVAVWVIAAVACALALPTIQSAVDTRQSAFLLPVPGTDLVQVVLRDAR